MQMHMKKKSSFIENYKFQSVVSHNLEQESKKNPGFSPIIEAPRRKEETNLFFKVNTKPKQESSSSSDYHSSSDQSPRTGNPRNPK